MDANKLVALGETVVAQLEQVWDRIGLEETERAAIRLTLKQQVEQAFTGAVQRHEQEAEALKAAITAAKQEIQAIHTALQRASLTPHAATEDASAPYRAVKAELETQLSALQTLKDEQLASLHEAFSMLHTIWEQLGTAPHAGFAQCDENDISDARLMQVHAKLEEAKQSLSEAEDYVMSTADTLAGLVRELALLEDEQMEIDRLVLAQDFPNIGVHVDTRRHMDERIEELEALKAARTTRFTELAELIPALWDRLCVDQAESDKFLGLHSGLGITTLNACEGELQRLLALKEASLAELITTARTRLTALWEETQVPEEGRRSFSPAFCDSYTDESLASHEHEIECMEARAAAMRPLMELIAVRAQLLEDKVEHDIELQDPNRFKKRGQMLKETEFRKRWKTLPRKEASLAKKILKWEAEHGPFLIGGARWLETMEQQVEEREGTSGKKAVSRTVPVPRQSDRKEERKEEEEKKAGEEQKMAAAKKQTKKKKKVLAKENDGGHTANAKTSKKPSMLKQPSKSRLAAPTPVSVLDGEDAPTPVAATRGHQKQPSLLNLANLY